MRRRGLNIIFFILVMILLMACNSYEQPQGSKKEDEEPRISAVATPNPTQTPTPEPVKILPEDEPSVLDKVTGGMGDEEVKTLNLLYCSTEGFAPDGEADLTENAYAGSLLLMEEDATRFEELNERLTQTGIAQENAKYHLRRSDTSCISFLKYAAADDESASQKAGELVGVCNIDVESGLDIPFKAVIKEREAFAKVLESEINRTAESGENDADAAEKLKKTAIEQVMTGELVWCLDYTGVTVFLKGEERTESVPIFFDSYPEVFTGRYQKTADSYMLRIYDEGYEYELKEQGKTDRIFGTEGESNQDGFFEEADICINGARAKYELTGRDWTPYFIHTNSANYLYVFYNAVGDFDGFIVMKANSSGAVATADNLFGAVLTRYKYCHGPESDDYVYCEVVYNPEEMSLTTEHDMLGKTYEKASYHLRQDGYPMRDDAFFSYEKRCVTLLKDTEMSRADSKTLEQADVCTLATGTVLWFYKTDAISCIWFTDETGNCYCCDLNNPVFEDGLSERFDGIITSDVEAFETE